MNKYKFLILGAGATGLTVANRLKELGEESFYVLEKEAEAGGLCRSEMVDAAPLDIGGGHFLDVRRPKVNEFLFSFMPEEEWNLFERDSRIIMNGQEINHPLEANIWQMDIDNQIQYLMSIAKAGCNQGQDMPKLFIEWIQWKLGNRIAEDYMIPYNSKMFGHELNELGTYWLDKLPNVSFEETLRSCLEKKPFGEQPGHAKFYYPKEYGYGELWKRMADNIASHIEYEKEIYSIDFDNNHVITADGKKYEAEFIITTIPWKSIKCFQGMPETMVDKIKRLKHTGIEVKYFSQNLDSKAHWLYYPEEELTYHRILLRSNFCNNSRGYWTETNLDRVHNSIESVSYNNEYAYPLNTIEKPQIMKEIITWANSRNIYPVGRWGEHQHHNSDKVVELGMELAERLVHL